jgi:hypothetical protein
MRRQRQSLFQNKFDQNLFNTEKDQETVYLDNPVELAGRFLADRKWKHKADLRMKKSEQFLSHLMSRGNKADNQTKLLSYHSEMLMLGGGDARFARSVKVKRKQQLNGLSPKPRKKNPIKYTSPLLAPGGPRKTPSVSRKRQKQNIIRNRPSSASPGTIRKRTSERKRPQSAFDTYVRTGKTPSEKYLRPYSAALPLKLDLPWMKIKPEQRNWRASWEPTKPLTYTPQSQLKPIVAKRKKKKIKRPDEHRAVEWARLRRELLEPLTKRENQAASIIQRFFSNIKFIDIRDKWSSYHAGQVLRRHSGAVVIQRHVRGFFIRKLVKKQNISATVIQSNWRIVLSRKRIELFRKVIAMRKRMMVKKIQRGFRSGAVRRGVRRMVAQAGEFGKHAIVKMQGLFRGKIGRRKSAERRSWLNQAKKSASNVGTNIRNFLGGIGGGKKAPPRKKNIRKLEKAQTPKPKSRFGFFSFGKKNKSSSTGSMAEDIKKNQRGFTTKKRKSKPIIKNRKKR